MQNSKLDSQALKDLKASACELCNAPMRAWKADGKKIVGVLYNFVPEELLTAAGVLPYRVRALGSTSTALAAARFDEFNCSLVRHFYNSAAEGSFGFLDGLVSVNSCDHERRLFDNWVAKVETGYSYFLCFPKKTGAEQAQVYRERLEGFKASLEEAFGVELTDEKIRAAIDLHNETRRLQRALYDLRKRPDPPISGADALAVMLAGTCMPKTEYNELLARLLKDCAGAEGIAGSPLRVIVYGGELDSIPLMEMIESQGALIVGDSLGLGYRSCADDVKDTGDPLYDLAAYMVLDHGDPRLFGTAESRAEFVFEQLEACGAAAVIMPTIPMCDLWGYERSIFGSTAKRNGVPVLDLSVEYAVEESGQIKTRVQAFVETLSERN